MKNDDEDQGPSLGEVLQALIGQRRSCSHEQRLREMMGVLAYMVRQHGQNDEVAIPLEAITAFVMPESAAEARALMIETDHDSKAMVLKLITLEQASKMADKGSDTLGTDPRARDLPEPDAPSSSKLQ